MASHNLDGPTISNITSKEKQITGEARPVKDGPTAQAQKHTGQRITDSTVSAIADGENTITHEDVRRPDGPTAFVESLASGQEAPATTVQHTGKLDDSTISAIAEAEKRITGQDDLVDGGPTVQAQKHAGEPINRASLHDITEGEKTITHEVSAVKGGPTAVAQSELSKRALSTIRLFGNVHHNGSEPINAILFLGRMTSRLPPSVRLPYPAVGAAWYGNFRQRARRCWRPRRRKAPRTLGPPYRTRYSRPPSSRLGGSRWGALVQVAPFSPSCEIAASA
ncbi:hypothetical protein DL764_001007 [Monosporascus ibericus]|uniref:SMP domain-containing protein n=1 Tax=Monosporascus ibericus TaxID=155417 RepID=A0A4Q4TWB0_9PEZI|nr:hypothetical protein DL764_001007 [Monosporascus ibericus]